MIASFMNNARLDSLICECSAVQERRPGFWRIEYRDHAVIVMSDEVNDRMRIFTPVVEITEISESVWLMALSANFDRALDARYAVNGDYLWSVFLHPLSLLSEGQFADVLNQVINLANNFGVSFSSSDIVFEQE